MSLALRGARIVDAEGERQADLVIEHGRITHVAEGPAGTDQVVDATGAVVSWSPEHQRAASRVDQIVDASGAVVTPGFVDVHTHGGGGFNLHTTDPEEIRQYTRWAATTGTTAFLAGVVGVPGGMPEAQLTATVEAIEAPGEGAELLGIHLEGPYISHEKRGAHDPAWLRVPNPVETARILELSRGRLRLVTLAPELRGAPEMIRTLVEARVTVSIGHTDATYEQARDAIPLGISHATHCFNAMRPLHHREPGALGAILEAEQVLGELIGDCVHVHPAVMKVLIRALGLERTVVVTDALSAAGCPGVEFTFAGQRARVEGGAARLESGALTGSVLTMDQALRNLVHGLGVPLPAAIGMLSRNPARSAGVADRKGLLREGYDADVLIFDEGLTLQATLCKGRLAYATDAWRSRLENG